MMVSMQFLLTSLVVVLIPGTGVLYTVSAGLFWGKKASVYAALGCTFGIVPSLLASVLGLAAIFHTSALAFQVIKYLGVVYLLYLALIMWRSSSSFVLDENRNKTNGVSIAIKGFLINILNPKLSVFFLAFLPQFVSTTPQDPLWEMLLLGAVFMLMTLVVFIVYGFMAGYFSQLLLRSEKLTSAIQKFFAGSFTVLGLKLALSEQR